MQVLCVCAGVCACARARARVCVYACNGLALVVAAASIVMNHTTHTGSRSFVRWLFVIVRDNHLLFCLLAFDCADTSQDNQAAQDPLNRQPLSKCCWLLCACVRCMPGGWRGHNPYDVVVIVDVAVIVVVIASHRLPCTLAAKEQLFDNKLAAALVAEWRAWSGD